MCLPGSPGKVGGKAAGLFLAQQILRKAERDGVDIGPIRIPKTWHIASDTIHTFVLFNHLEEVYEQKYKDLDQVRLEYPHLIQVFKNSELPPEIVKGLSMALDDLHEGPLIVRSSSLLEDRAGAIFSGKYKSLFLHNRGSKQERLAALLDAVAEVYASIFGPDPIQYRAERGLLHLREEMGIMIQEVVGTRIGRYWAPAFAGVGFSHTDFRWSPRIRREDGLLRLVPGLGTRAVDRVREDFPVLVSPGQPSLRVNVTTDEVLRYAPRTLDVIDLDQRTLTTLDMQALLREHGHEYPALHRLVSVREGDRLTRPSGLLLDPEHDDLVVTFDGLIGGTPFLRQFSAILKTLQAATGNPVDVEFASDGRDLYILQCRPQSRASGAVGARIPSDLPEARLLFTANRFVSNGQVPDLTHIVYVDPDAYAGLVDLGDLQAVGRAVSRLNAVLPRRQFILMGPGRWGSRGDIKLGVTVTYSDINNAAMLIEIARARGGAAPDLSFGTHFFQDLVEASIRYLPLYPDDPGIVFAESFFMGSENRLAGAGPRARAPGARGPGRRRAPGDQGQGAAGAAERRAGPGRGGARGARLDPRAAGRGEQRPRRPRRPLALAPGDGRAHRRPARREALRRGGGLRPRLRQERHGGPVLRHRPAGPRPGQRRAAPGPQALAGRLEPRPRRGELRPRRRPHRRPAGRPHRHRRRPRRPHLVRRPHRRHHRPRPRAEAQGVRIGVESQSVRGVRLR